MEIRRTWLIVFAINALLLVSVACAPAPPPKESQASAETPSPTSTPIRGYWPAKSPRPTSTPSPEPDFDLAENLTYEELEALNERVMNEKKRRGLSDQDALILLKKTLRSASIARWKQDGKKWFVRDESSPYYKK